MITIEDLNDMNKKTEIMESDMSLMAHILAGKVKDVHTVNCHGAIASSIILKLVDMHREVLKMLNETHDELVKATVENEINEAIGESLNSKEDKQ